MLFSTRHPRRVFFSLIVFVMRVDVNRFKQKERHSLKGSSKVFSYLVQRFIVPHRHMTDVVVNGRYAKCEYTCQHIKGDIQTIQMPLNGDQCRKENQIEQGLCIVNVSQEQLHMSITRLLKKPLC